MGQAGGIRLPSGIIDERSVSRRDIRQSRQSRDGRIRMHTVLYALSTCPYCRMTKKYLDKNEVDYDLIEVDLLEGDEKEQAIAKVRELSGGTSFPVIVIGDEVIVGFNKVRVKELLGL